MNPVELSRLRCSEHLILQGLVATQMGQLDRVHVLGVVQNQNRDIAGTGFQPGLAQHGPMMGGRG